MEVDDEGGGGYITAWYLEEFRSEKEEVVKVYMGVQEVSVGGGKDVRIIVMMMVMMLMMTMMMLMMTIVEEDEEVHVDLVEEGGVGEGGGGGGEGGEGGEGGRGGDACRPCRGRW